MEMPRYLKKRRVSYKVTPIEVESVKPKRSYMPGESRILAKQIAREVCGLMPYEKKAVDIIKSDNLKKARKFLKKRLGSMSRAEKKFEYLYSQNN